VPEKTASEIGKETKNKKRQNKNQQQQSMLSRNQLTI